MAKAGHGTMDASKTLAWASKHACDLLSDTGTGMWLNTRACGIQIHNAMLGQGATHCLDPAQPVAVHVYG